MVVSLDSGDLAATPLAAVLLEALAVRATGALCVNDAGTHARVFVRDGLPAGAQSFASFRPLGQILVQQGRIDMDALSRSLADMARSGRPQGEILIEMGAVSREDVARALAEQQAAYLRDISARGAGVYTWQAGLAPEWTRGLRIPPLRPLVAALEPSAAKPVVDEILASFDSDIAADATRTLAHATGATAQPTGATAQPTGTTAQPTGATDPSTGATVLALAPAYDSVAHAFAWTPAEAALVEMLRGGCEAGAFLRAATARDPRTARAILAILVHLGLAAPRGAAPTLAPAIVPLASGGAGAQPPGRGEAPAASAASGPTGAAGAAATAARSTASAAFGVAAPGQSTATAASVPPAASASSVASTHGAPAPREYPAAPPRDARQRLVDRAVRNAGGLPHAPPGVAPSAARGTAPGSPQGRAEGTAPGAVQGSANGPAHGATRGDAARETEKVERSASSAEVHGRVTAAAAAELRSALAVILPRASERDLFARLGLPRTATRDQVKQAYLQLAKRFHPDRFLAQELADLQPAVQQLFAALNEAYDVLGDDRRRTQHLATIGAAWVTDDAAARVDYEKGEACLRTRDYPRARAFFETAARADPRPEYLAAAAYAILLEGPRGDREHARDLVRGALADPRCDRAAYVAGVLAREEGDDAAAERHFRAALHANPRHADAARELRELEMRRSGKSRK